MEKVSVNSKIEFILNNLDGVCSNKLKAEVIANELLHGLYPLILKVGMKEQSNVK